MVDLCPAGTSWWLERVPCAVCGADDARSIGTRGNREHAGADRAAEPHIATTVVRCRRCGFIYTNPMIRGLEDLEHSHYDDPVVYQFAAGSVPADNVDERLRIIARHVGGRQLLDVGAGKGEFLRGAQSAGFDAVGAEPSARFCSYARSTHGVTMYEGTLEDIGELADRRFDVVTALHVLEHVDTPHAFVASLVEHTAPGGLVVIEVPNGGSIALVLADAYHRLRGRRWSSRVSPIHPPFHRFAHTRSSLERLLDAADLRIVELRTLGGLGRDVVRPRGRGRIEWALRRLASRLASRVRSGEFLFVIARRADR